MRRPVAARRALRRSPAGASLVAAATVPMIVAGCMPAPATTQAEAVSTLWTQFAVAAAIVGGTVWILITFMILRYRNRPSDHTALPSPSQFVPLEIAWTAIPVLIVLVLFVLTLVAMGTVDARVPTRVTVDVTAFRWQWRFDYPGTNASVVGGPDTPAVMVVPAGEPIHIVLNSVDVDHSFYVPAFLFKRDAIPGKPNEFDLTISDPGDYRGQCAEFCGVYHDRMLMTVHAVTRPEYEAWLATQAAVASGAPSPAALAPASVEPGVSPSFPTPTASPTPPLAPSVSPSGSPR